MPRNPAMVPIQSDSLAMNFQFDIIRKNAYTVVNWFSEIKISKIGATRCQILRLKRTKFDFRLQRSPDPLAVFNGLLLRGGGKRGGEGKGEGKRREGRGGKGGEGWVAPNWGVWIRRWGQTCAQAWIILSVLARWFFEPVRRVSLTLRQPDFRYYFWKPRRSTCVFKLKCASWANLSIWKIFNTVALPRINSARPGCIWKEIQSQ